jgi:hypothetical protein
METNQVAELQELAHRKNDALMVTLWWVKGTLDTYVEVIDLKEQPPRVTEIPVRPPASPNDVFNHPFRYLADAPTLELSE